MATQLPTSPAIRGQDPQALEGAAEARCQLLVACCSCPTVRMQAAGQARRASLLDGLPEVLPGAAQHLRHAPRLGQLCARQRCAQQAPVLYCSDGGAISTTQGVVPVKRCVHSISYPTEWLRHTLQLSAAPVSQLQSQAVQNTYAALLQAAQQPWVPQRQATQPARGSAALWRRSWGTVCGC